MGCGLGCAEREREREGSVCVRAGVWPTPQSICRKRENPARRSERVCRQRERERSSVYVTLRSTCPRRANSRINEESGGGIKV